MYVFMANASSAPIDQAYLFIASAPSRSAWAPSRIKTWEAIFIKQPPNLASDFDEYKKIYDKGLVKRLVMPCFKHSYPPEEGDEVMSCDIPFCCTNDGSIIGIRLDGPYYSGEVWHSKELDKYNKSIFCWDSSLRTTYSRGGYLGECPIHTSACT